MVNAEFYMEAESEARADVEFDVEAKQDQQMGQTMGLSRWHGHQKLTQSPSQMNLVAATESRCRKYTDSKKISSCILVRRFGRSFSMWSL